MKMLTFFIKLTFFQILIISNISKLRTNDLIYIVSAIENYETSECEIFKTQLIDLKKEKVALEEQILILNKDINKFSTEIENFAGKENIIKELTNLKTDLTNNLSIMENDLKECKDLNHITNYKVEELFGYLKTLHFDGIMEFETLKDLEKAEINCFDYFMQKISRLNYDSKTKEKYIVELKNNLTEAQEKELLALNTIKQAEIINIKTVWGSISLTFFFYHKFFEYSFSKIPVGLINFYDLQKSRIEHKLNTFTSIPNNYLSDRYLPLVENLYQSFEVLQSIYYKYFHSNLYKFYIYISHQWIINSLHMSHIFSNINTNLNEFGNKFLNNNSYLQNCFPSSIANKVIFLISFSIITYIFIKIIAKGIWLILKLFSLIFRYLFPKFFIKKIKSNDSKPTISKGFINEKSNKLTDYIDKRSTIPSELTDEKFPNSIDLIDKKLTATADFKNFKASLYANSINSPDKKIHQTSNKRFPKYH